MFLLQEYKEIRNKNSITIYNDVFLFFVYTQEYLILGHEDAKKTANIGKCNLCFY